MRRLIPALILLALVSIPAFPQEAPIWANLNQLRSGQKINLVGLDRKKFGVNFLGATEDSLRVRYQGKEVVLPRSEVLLVSLQAPPKWQQILLGLAAGAIMGAGAWAAADRSERGCWHHYCESDEGLSGRSAAIMTGVGAGAGALIAAFVKDNERVIYAFDVDQPPEMPPPMVMPGPVPIAPLALLDLQPDFAEFEEGARCFSPVAPAPALAEIPAEGPA